MKTLKTLAVISITSSLLGFSAGSLAGDNQVKTIEVRSQVVTFYDLDLVKPADAQMLLERINHAAKIVCGKSSVNNVDLHANIDLNRCMDQSYKDTVAQVDNRFNTSIEKIAAMAGKQRRLVSKR